jgi:amphi-Trp domain-containing protein
LLPTNAAIGGMTAATADIPTARGTDQSRTHVHASTIRVRHTPISRKLQALPAHELLARRPRHLRQGVDTLVATHLATVAREEPLSTVLVYPPNAPEEPPVDLFEIAETQHLRREEAAARLHALADVLAGNNSVEFEGDGRRITVSVPDEVELKVEVELGDVNEQEIELTW